MEKYTVRRTIGTGITEKRVFNNKNVMMKYLNLIGIDELKSGIMLDSKNYQVTVYKKGGK